MEQNPCSANNRLILEKYVKGELRHKSVNGFALVDQKVNLKGLKLLADAFVTTGTQSWTLPKHSMVYIKEEVLHTAAWAQKAYESDTFPVPFLIADFSCVEYVIHYQGVK